MKTLSEAMVMKTVVIGQCRTEIGIKLANVDTTEVMMVDVPNLAIEV